MKVGGSVRLYVPETVPYLTVAPLSGDVTVNPSIVCGSPSYVPVYPVTSQTQGVIGVQTTFGVI